LIIIQLMKPQTLALPLIGGLLKEKQFYLATAESCSGGLLGHLITNVPGSSDYYLGGFITYSNQAKQHFLGVRRQTLQTFGAVSRETVLEMARGARLAFKEEYSAENLVSQMIVPGSSYWNIGIGHKKGEVENDAEGMATMEELGRNIAWLLRKLQ